MVFGKVAAKKLVKVQIRELPPLFSIDDAIAKQSFIGPEPIPVLVTSLDSFELRVAYDAETNISLLQPHKESREETHHA